MVGEADERRGTTPPPRGRPTAGDLFGGRYRAVRPVGRGSTATVWSARDLVLDRTVALKVPHPGLIDASEQSARLIEEGRAAAAVSHRNVVRIHDVSSTLGGVPYLVMDFLDGETLASRLGREGRLPVAEALRLARGALRGLHAIHSVGRLHCDLKPDNVFVLDELDGAHAVLLDFGVSRGRTDAPSGWVRGTPAYMSPEQARGRPLDRRSDLFTAGLLLFEMLAGTLPLVVDDVATLLRRVATEQAPSLGSVAPWLADPVVRVVDRALALSPDQRFADAADMHRALGSAVAEGYPRRRDLVTTVDRAESGVTAIGGSSSQRPRTSPADQTLEDPEHARASGRNRAESPSDRIRFGSKPPS